MDNAPVPIVLLFWNWLSIHERGLPSKVGLTSAPWRWATLGQFRYAIRMSTMFYYGEVGSLYVLARFGLAIRVQYSFFESFWFRQSFLDELTLLSLLIALTHMTSIWWSSDADGEISNMGPGELHRYVELSQF